MARLLRTSDEIDLLALFRKSPLLVGLPDEVLIKLASKSETHVSYAGQTIMEEGEEGAEVYLVVSGSVRIQLECITPFVEVGINKVEQGEVIGEMSLVDDSPRSATVIAIGPCQLVRIPLGELRAIADADPKLGMILMTNTGRILAERLKMMNRRLMNYVRARSY
ncbi:hypothetical protein BH09SUM1_BH09SUM1_04980 [soil metagenome]